jgi:3',5'-cyclic-AMP phosphodiesterase
MRLLVLSLASLLFGGCLKSTPFKTEPDETDLTGRELRRLEALGEPAGAFTFLAFGDTHDEYDDLETSVGIMNQTDARFALIAGDLSDRGTLQEFEWSGELYRKLHMPFLTVLGNHDAISDGKEIYRKMYGPLDYSFRYGPLKFVLFDSNNLETPSAPDRDWLRSQVEDHGDAQGVVLVTHQSLLDSDAREGGDNHVFYDELLQGGDVVLVVHGHLDAQRLRVKHGVPVLQCGTFQTTRLYNLVHFDGERFSFTSCRFEDCHDLEPEAVQQ